MLAPLAMPLSLAVMPLWGLVRYCFTSIKEEGSTVNNPITVITDKVMAMIRSMVYLAMRVGHRHGATTTEIAGFLNYWAPSANGEYHEGVVERVLYELHQDGLVVQAGPRWYLASTAR